MYGVGGVFHKRQYILQEKTKQKNPSPYLFGDVYLTNSLAVSGKYFSGNCNEEQWAVFCCLDL